MKWAFPRFILGVGVALACLGWTAASEATVGVTVSPSRFRLTKEAGEAAPGKVNIKNDGSYPISISTEITDIVIRLNEEGLSIRDEAPAGTTPHSCASWIQIVNQGEFIIPAGKTGTLEFVVSPPPEVKSGGYGAYLFVLSRPVDLPAQQKSDKPEVQLVTVPRLGASVVYEVKDTLQRKGDLVKLELTPPTKTRPLKIRHEFVNTGNAEVVLEGTFHIMDSQNILVGKGTLRLLKTFPGERAVTESTWAQGLAPGRYTALVTLELGPDSREAIVREIAFDVSAP